MSRSQDPPIAPAVGDGRTNHNGRHAGARLKFFYGPMDCGKSTLALQMDHNHARQRRRGLLVTKHDRSGQPQITTRLGLGREAIELDNGTDLRDVVRALWSAGERVDYLICDEVQFYQLEQVEQMADLVDGADVDVYAFGLATDFRSYLFPAVQRLFELADEVVRLQVEVLCWCGRQGHLNARVESGEVVREGARVVIGDTDAARVRYQVLCRRHYRSGDLGPSVPAVGQLELS
jgi:thymidine kinase